ncbi:hypothetical protein C8J56DRAFT_1156806 [Mycena floridula]|nr:hypothetical protein C8J56DRAFT_1156806 [Mycena floridula]
MSSNPSKVLLLTLSELGQANSILAILSELLTRDGLEVHIASFAVLEKHVNKVVSQSSNAMSTVKFHPLSGLSYAESLLKKTGVSFGEYMVHPPTSCTDLSVASKYAKFFQVFSDEDHISQIQEMTEIIRQIDPDVIIVDILFTSALDACRALKRRRVVNIPTQSLDFLITTLSGWLWRYPPLASVYSYPLSWPDKFKSIYVSLRMFKLMVDTTECQELIMFRKKHNLDNHAIVSGYNEEDDYINPSLDCTDFPLTCPANFHRCGPLVLDTIPVGEADPELAQWLSKAPTIFICLGSHHQYTETDVRGILGGLLTDLPAQTQVLWKLRGSFESLIEEMFLKHGTKSGDRFRILDWIGPDPASVLQHPNVLCSVHHGGANSFFEACYAGKPQIILAKWWDLYPNAIKEAVYHRLGIYGNRNVAPDVEAVEFGKAVSRVMGDSKEALEFRASASRVAQLCQEAGGRKTAVDHILEIMKKKEKETVHV